ncbi:MAG: hypothetical protein ABSH51_20325 [Solirubrobacteraceae bacterium]|jgi:hypothetical protein
MEQHESQPAEPPVTQDRVPPTSAATVSSLESLTTRGVLRPRTGLTGLSGLHEAVGNRATGRLLRDLRRRLARETYYRGRAAGVGPSKAGAGKDPTFGIHDFGDGLYLTTDHEMARQYASDRAGENKDLQEVLKGDIARGDLGKVLDLNGDSQWADYTKQPIFPNGPTPEALIKGANQNYWKFFQAFLKNKNLTLEDYDTIIGPEYVRGGTQVCVRTPDVQTKVTAALTAFERGATFEPVSPPSSGPASGSPPAAAGGGPAGVGPTEPEGSPPPQGSGLTASRGEEIKPIENPAADFQARSGAASAGAFAVMMTLSAVGNWLQERAAREEWDKTRDSVASTLTQQPWLGVMIVYRYTQGSAPIGMSAPRIFQGIDTYYGDTREVASNNERQAGILLPAGPEDTISAQRRWVPPARPGSKPSARQAPAAAPAGPKSASGLDADIDKAISRNSWTDVALTLNGFNTDDIKIRVTTDSRLTGHRSELMKGALAGMILWPPPNHVADAIFDADGTAARQGRIDYVNETVDTGRSGEPPRNFGSEKGKRAALALNGFSDDDLRRFLPADLDKLKLMRDEAVTSGLDRVKQAIEAMKPGQDWNLPG